MLALYFSSVDLGAFVQLLPFVRLSVDGQPVDEVGRRPVRARPLLASGADTRQPVAVLLGTNSVKC